MHVGWLDVQHSKQWILLRLSWLFKSLLGRTTSRGRCRAAIRSSHCPEWSGHAVHGEVDGSDIGGQHGWRFVLLRHTHTMQRRPGHTTSVQARAETSDTGAEAVKPDSGSSLEGLSRGSGCRCRGWKCGVLWGGGCAGVVRRHPVTIGKVSLMAGSIRRVCALRHQTGAPQERDAWCQLLAKWPKVSAIRERPVQRYSEVFGLGEEGQGKQWIMTLYAQASNTLPYKRIKNYQGMSF